MIRMAFPAAMIFGIATAALAADPGGRQTASAPMAAPSTAAFEASVAAGNQFEIDSSKLALSRARSDSVKAFAQRMIDDHTAAGKKFKQAVSEAKLPAPPDKLDAKHQAILDQLKAKDAGSFDKAYIDVQYKAHVETVDLVKAYANGGDNARMKAFAQAVLPTLESHLDQVSKMH